MEDNRPRYPTACPVCNKKLYVCKSIGQELGMSDFGAGKCIYCDTWLKLIFDEETKCMKASVHKGR